MLIIQTITCSIAVGWDYMKVLQHQQQKLHKIKVGNGIENENKNKKKHIGIEWIRGAPI